MNKFDEIIERRGTGSVKYDGLEMLYGDADLLPMWVADMDFKVPEEVTKALVERAQHGVFGYTLPDPNHTIAPVEWHEKRNSISYDRESIFFTSSVLCSLNLMIVGLTEEDDTVMMSMPTYGPFVKVPTGAKRNWVGSSLVKSESTYNYDFEEFEKQLIENDVKLYILCNPHNPTGRVWLEEEIERVLEICHKHNVIVISDEVHSDLIMPGHSFTPAMKVARKLGYSEEIVILTAPTKTFNMAGLQVSYYIVENEEYKVKINEAKDYTHVSDLLNSFSYVAMKAAYEHGSDYVDELTSYIYSNYLYMKEVLADKCEFVKVTDLQATYLTWLDVSSLGISEENLRVQLVKSGLAVETSQDFFEINDVCIRINLACPRSVIKEGITRLVSALNELR
ncbi:PatB family C-S lyase [Vagococcus sp. PNs007]|uniref:cysteine-S-conjugate beta-lyase n=1 Tax=Vagococcus proximus TaxID=2991417 RepID=A0ABT5WZ32_9ENTE|nr:PatB family C-S lyase [Vagococcus proximus]MDF0479023.1 PatB family C-S lyase [Vagococcus proximus]